MKVLLLNGSPHKNGCTHTALSEVAKALESEGIETETIWIGVKPVPGCIACGGCVSGNGCVISAEVNEFVEKAKSADGFVIGSPVYYAGMAGSLKSYLDRAFYSGSRNKEDGDVFKLKPAAAVVSARRAGTTETYDQIIKYFGINQMPIISSRYWNMVHGQNPEQVLKDEEGMQTMRILGKNMAYFLKCIDAGKKSDIEQPAAEQTTYTNFIR